MAEIRLLGIRSLIGFEKSSAKKSKYGSITVTKLDIFIFRLIIMFPSTKNNKDNLFIRIIRLRTLKWFQLVEIVLKLGKIDFDLQTIRQLPLWDWYQLGTNEEQFRLLDL